METMPMVADGPIGIFDSGIGGLSVLRHIRLQLPHENLLYFADTGHAPYGGKTEVEIVARSLAIADFLLARGAKVIVVACNTATAAAIAALRLRYPDLPLVGVEPGLKPAAAITRSGVVGVLATEGTLASAKFHLLQEQITATTGVRFVVQACTGLAIQIEKGELYSAATAILVRRFVEPLLLQHADTLVLGCTHYPFVRPLIEDIAGQLAANSSVAIIDTGEAVARQLQRLLTQTSRASSSNINGMLAGFTTGSESSLSNAFSTLLKVQGSVVGIAVQTAA